MDRNKFWRIIEKSRKRAKKDISQFPKELEKRLLKLDSSELGEFEGILTEYVSAANMPGLWSAAAVMCPNGCPRDLFGDFREWLVAQGRKTYMAVLADPDSLVDVASFGENSKAELFSTVEKVYEWHIKNRRYPCMPYPDEAKRNALREEIPYGPKIHLMQTALETIGCLPRLTARYGPLEACLLPDWASEQDMALLDGRWEASPALLREEEKRGLEMLREANQHTDDAVSLLLHLVPGCGIGRDIRRAAIGQLMEIEQLLRREIEKEWIRIMPEEYERLQQDTKALYEMVEMAEALQDEFFGGSWLDEEQEEGAPMKFYLQF